MTFEGMRLAPDGKSVSGIISYLTSLHGGNIPDLGVIEATSSSVNDLSRSAKNVTDL
jgi:hypothetical protein